MPLKRSPARINFRLFRFTLMAGEINLLTFRFVEAAPSSRGRPTKSKMDTSMLAIFGAIALCIFGSFTPAQEAIRVEANQILVSVFVLDKDHLDRLRNDPGTLFRAALAGDMKVVGAITDGIVIHGLTAADFHLFDDGKEQVIQNVSYVRTPYRDVRDNAGHHTEFVGPGGGKWSTVEWPPGLLSLA
jgi:hypothetical protein